MQIKIWLSFEWFVIYTVTFSRLMLKTYYTTNYYLTMHRYAVLFMSFIFIWGVLFIVAMSISGLDSASGILFLKFTDRYKQSAALTAWLGSLATALRLSLGMLLITSLPNR